MIEMETLHDQKDLESLESLVEETWMELRNE
jgi:hypothetical protein